MRMNTILVVVICFFALASCKGAKNVSTESVINLGYEAAVYAIDANKVVFDTFESKAKVRFEDEERRISFKTTIRIKKDEKIWISGGILGFEGVRVLITPDSIQVIDRIKKQYYTKPIEYLAKMSNLPVDFEGMQNLLLGNPLFFDETNAKYDEKQGIVELVSELDNLVNILWLDNENLLLDRQTLVDEPQSRTMEMSYHDYRPEKNGHFAYDTDIHVTGKDEAWIDMDYTSIEINGDPSFSFFVNPRYERVHK